MAGMTNSLAAAVLTTFFENGVHYLGLHSTDPTAAGLAGGEISGGSYQRQLVNWTAPNNRAVLNNNTIIFDNLPAATVQYFVFWTAQVGGSVDYVLDLGASPQTFNSGGRLVIPVQDISITLQ